MDAWAEALVTVGAVAVALGCWTRRRRLAAGGAIAALLAVGAVATLLAAVLPADAVPVGAGGDLAILAALALALRAAASPRARSMDLGPARRGRSGDGAPGDAEARHRRLEQALTIGRHGLFEIDLAERAMRVSEGLCGLLGRTVPPGASLTIADALYPDDWADFQATYRLMEIGLARRAAGDFRFRHDDGGVRWLHCRFDVAGRDAGGGPRRILVVATDVSERKSNELRLQHLALHDALTGLYNRAAFMAQQARPHAAGEALLLVDLDRFKRVNDRYGHGMGDAWLAEVARRLREVVRREDFVARIGGDEFAVVPAGGIDAVGVEELAQRLTARLEMPFHRVGTRITASACVGAARLEAASEDGTALFRAADEALYAAKELGRGRYLLQGRRTKRKPPLRRRRA